MTLALLFGVAMLAFAGGQPAGEFYAGWLTEYSLSVDMALVLRGIFILIGAAAIEPLRVVFWIFGAFLLDTAVTLALHQAEGEDEFEENVLIRRLRAVLPMHTEYDGAKIRTVADGQRLFTPMLVVFAAIATTDLLFALDSIPAIFGLTLEPFKGACWTAWSTSASACR